MSNAASAQVSRKRLGWSSCRQLIYSVNPNNFKAVRCLKYVVTFFFNDPDGNGWAVQGISTRT